MTGWWRKLALTAHVTASVGWLGAVAATLVLAGAVLIADDVRTISDAYRGMELLGWYALLPFSIASFLTGIVQGLGTRWGLFRHYWVLAKLVLNLIAVSVLLLYLRTLEELAATADRPETPPRDPSPLVHGSAALALLIVTTVLSVYKPRGLTPYGWRRQAAHRDAPA